MEKPSNEDICHVTGVYTRDKYKLSTSQNKQHNNSLPWLPKQSYTVVVEMRRKNYCDFAHSKCPLSWHSEDPLLQQIPTPLTSPNTHSLSQPPASALGDLSIILNHESFLLLAFTRLVLGFFLPFLFFISQILQGWKGHWVLESAKLFTY